MGVFINEFYEKHSDGTETQLTNLPFEIPTSWTWCRLKDIFILIFSGKTPKYSSVPNSNFVIGQKNNQIYGIDFNFVKYATDDFFRDYPENFFLRDNDVLLNTLGGGTVGRVGLFEDRYSKRVISDGHLFVFRSSYCITQRYMFYWFKTMQKFIEKEAAGTTNQMFLKLTNVSNYLVSLPPLSEQERIVGKIEEAFYIA